MAVLPFMYYLHDDYSSNELADWLQEQIPDLTEEQARLAAEKRPFYEVTLECALDTETGAVTIVGAKL